MAKIQFSAQIVGVQSKVDKTCKVSLNTQELGTDAGELMNISGEQVSVLFVTLDEKVTDDDIPPAPLAGEEYGTRTPSQQQRAILYRIWEAKGKPTNNFEAYYRMRMSRNEELLKAELDKLTI